MAMSQQYTPPVNKYTGSYTEDADGDGVRMNAFGHDDADISFDPLSVNRRFPGTADLAVLGTLVFAGPTRESIDVMVPDCIVPPASGSVRVDLRHHVSLSLGPALDMANWVPEPNMEKALCPSSLADTLGLQRRQYWEELNPILKKWKSVNNSHCPECDRPIKVNMARHLRLVHTTYVCFWRCPVMSCSLWFTSYVIKTILRESTNSRKAMALHFTNASDNTALSGSGAGPSSRNVDRLPKPYGWTWPWRADRDKSWGTRISLPRARNMPPYGGSLRPLSTSCRYCLICHWWRPLSRNHFSHRCGRWSQTATMDPQTAAWCCYRRLVTFPRRNFRLPLDYRSRPYIISKPSYYFAKARYYFREREILFRESKIIFRQSEILFRESEIIFRESEILFRESEILFRESEILFRESEIKFIHTRSEGGHIPVALVRIHIKEQYDETK